MGQKVRAAALSSLLMTAATNSQALTENVSKPDAGITLHIAGSSDTAKVTPYTPNAPEHAKIPFGLVRTSHQEDQALAENGLRMLTDQNYSDQDLIDAGFKAIAIKSRADCLEQAINTHGNNAQKKIEDDTLQCINEHAKNSKADPVKVALASMGTLVTAWSIALAYLNLGPVSFKTQRETPSPNQG